MEQNKTDWFRCIANQISDSRLARKMVSNFQIGIMMAFATVAIAASPLRNDVTVETYLNSRPSQNSYDFRYILSDGSYRMETGQLLNMDSENPILFVRGKYSWIAPNGEKYVVNYTADENGYTPTFGEKPSKQTIPKGVIGSLLG